MRALRWLAPVALVIVAASCASSPGLREPWVYGVSRTIYAAISAGPPPRIEQPARDQNAAATAMFFAVVLVVPFAFDTIVLPVTVPHDLLFVE
jgi:hypothetical protein